MLWIPRTGAIRFYRWQHVGIFQCLFDTLTQQAGAAGQLDRPLHSIGRSIVRGLCRTFALLRQNRKSDIGKPMTRAP
jgi:hypothetical protein